MNKNYKNKGNSRSPKGSKQQRSFKRESTSDFQKPTRDEYLSDKDTRKPIGQGFGRENDVSWYSANPQLLKDAASLAYSWPTGLPVSFNVGGDLAPMLDNTCIPGVMALWLVHMAGVSNDTTSPVSIAAQNIYSYVRHANSGHPNYDPADLMMYLLAMDDVYSYYTFLIRIYGLLNAYTQKNRYYPRALIEGMCVDFDDAISHIADLRYYINNYAVKIGSMCVPSSMSYFTRHQWIYSQIFTDSTSAKAQSFMYCPYGFRRYDELSGPGALRFVQFYNRATKHKFESLIGYGNMLMGSLLASEDCGIISGDILKAFTSNGVFKVASLPDNYVVLPIFSEEVLSQIQNTTVLRPPANPSVCDITQDGTTGAIYCNYQISHGTNPGINAIFLGDRMMTMYKDQVEPGDTMVASRLTVAAEPSATPSFDNCRVASCGSEICVLGEMCRFTDISGQWAPNWGFQFSYANRVPDNQILLLAWFVSLQFISQFHFHPNVFLNWTQDEGTPLERAAYYFDVNNYNMVSNFELAKMHETALLSEFTVPQMGAHTPII